MFNITWCDTNTIWYGLMMALTIKKQDKYLKMKSKKSGRVGLHIWYTWKHNNNNNNKVAIYKFCSIASGSSVLGESLDLHIDPGPFRCSRWSWCKQNEDHVSCHWDLSISLKQTGCVSQDAPASAAACRCRACKQTGQATLSMSVIYIFCFLSMNKFW